MSSIDTSALGIATGAAQFQNGEHGQSGGNITLNVQNLLGAGATTRFIAAGASGQAAGQGRAGAAKPDLIVPTPPPVNAGPGPWTIGNSGGMAVFGWPFQRATYGWVYRTDGSQLPYSQIPFGESLRIVYVRSDPPCAGENGGTPRVAG